MYGLKALKAVRLNHIKYVCVYIYIFEVKKNILFDNSVCIYVERFSKYFNYGNLKKLL